MTEEAPVGKPAQAPSPTKLALGDGGQGWIGTSVRESEGNRTLVVSLEGFCSTIELHPRRAAPPMTEEASDTHLTLPTTPNELASGDGVPV